jgi:hypothetical protein
LGSVYFLRTTFFFLGAGVRLPGLSPYAIR